MTICGLGTDIVSVERITALVERHGQRFLDRIYRPEEQLVLRRNRQAAIAALAARWAAKEAFIKALGSGGLHVPYRDVELVRTTSGQPRLCLHGKALAALITLGATRTFVSMSHERDHALATVILL